MSPVGLEWWQRSAGWPVIHRYCTHQQYRSGQYKKRLYQHGSLTSLDPCVFWTIFLTYFFGVLSNLEHPEIILEFQIDGLDPCQGYLEGGISRGIFRKVFREFIDPEKQTSIPDSTYDALLCCAGFFQVIQPLSIMV